jgi:succinate dehydrogenase/fumarate reductase flavoprotein subunit
MSLENVVTTDVLVLGGGTAGCFAAIKAREQGLDVTIVDKAYAGKSGSSIAASGWWSVFNPDWGMDFDVSMNALNKNGEYINNREWTKIMLDDSWGTYEDLVAWGVEFPVEPDEMKDFLRTQIIRNKEKWQIHRLREPFGLLPLRHRKVTPALRKQAEKVGVKIMDRIMITDLLKQDGKVVGAIGFPLASYDVYIFEAKATILCGGMNSFRPPGMHKSCVTGDADGMAYRAGAEISGKEFPDMHFSLANYPAWKGTGELYPAYFYLTDAEGDRVPAMGMDLTMVSTIDVGKGPVVWDFDAAGPDDIEAMRAYMR